MLGDWCARSGRGTGWCGITQNSQSSHAAGGWAIVRRPTPRTIARRGQRRVRRTHVRRQSGVVTSG